jgi:outer membrane protein TolC
VAKGIAAGGVMRVVRLLLTALVICGCSRSHYRARSDREAYTVIAERMNNPAWMLPRTSIDPPPESRLHLPGNPDHSPMPPDDPAARRYMDHPDVHRGYRHWAKDGCLAAIEFPGWKMSQELDDNGAIVIDQLNAVELALLHSRDYQTQLEGLYRAALSVSLNRFDFATRWVLPNATDFTHFGSGPNESNSLSSATNFGFSKSLATGGQLLADFANSIVVEFTGNRVTGGSNFILNLIQPILRGAGREVRLEDLTQAEREMLYAVRDFARFRKSFWADVSTRGEGFLGLLQQLQGIRNEEANLASQEQNLRLHELLYAGGKVSVVQVDRVFQNYQQSRLSLATAKAQYENSLDQFKILLGLPPSQKVSLDDQLLRPFQLNDPALTTLQDDVEKLLSAYRQMAGPPTVADLRGGFQKLAGFLGLVEKMQAKVQEELASWTKNLARDAADDEEKERLARDRRNAAQLAGPLAIVKKNLQAMGLALAGDVAGIAENRRAEAAATFDKRGRELAKHIAQLFVVQTQIRVHLIELPRITEKEEEAIDFAFQNRLDLMNQRARVVDAWRKVTVAADGLEPGLNFVASANIGTDPDHARPFRFAAENSRYSVGLRFDSPLTRLAERNRYRASLIDYQQARRDFMEREDRIQQAIRRDLRLLTTQKLAFEIARLRLLAAARRVEAARDELLLREDASGTTSTQEIVDALNELLRARNDLIGSFVAYETLRVQLQLDTEKLQLTDRGVPVDATANANAAGAGSSNSSGPPRFLPPESPPR